jgi:hypothetical protein
MVKLCKNIQVYNVTSSPRVRLQTQMVMAEGHLHGLMGNKIFVRLTEV